MKLSKRIARLTKILQLHGDLDVKVADENGHTFSDACFSPSTARFEDGKFIRYTDDPIKTNAVIID